MLSKLPSNLIMYNSQKVIVTIMIGFVTWPPFLPQLFSKRWPSDRANHSCDNNLLTVVQNQNRRKF